MHGTLLADHVFEIRKADRYWKERPDKSRNLINAFSIAYDEILFILGISSVLLLLSGYLAVLGFIVYQRSVRNRSTFGVIILKHIYSFLRLRLSAFIQLLNSRITSSLYLAAIVFPKQITRIAYDRLFEKITEKKFKANGTEWQRGEDESLVFDTQLKHWRQFSLQNAVYLLSAKNNYQRIADLKAEPWYKAAGQFTTGYTLLRYAFRFDSSDPYWSDLQQQLVGDWTRFNQSPLWLHVRLSAG